MAVVTEPEPAARRAAARERAPAAVVGPALRFGRAVAERLARRPGTPLLPIPPMTSGAVAKTGGGAGRRIVAGLLLMPSFLAILYFAFFASDRYVSEAAFIVRSAQQGIGGGLGSFLQITGIARSQDDAFSVHEYIRSRDAVHDLEAILPLREMFARPEADFVARWPGPFGGESAVELTEYYLDRVEVIYDSTTGISTLRVQAFRPEDADRIARALLDLSEDLVNRMNARIRSDAVRFAEEEVAEAERRLLEAQLAVTRFRSRELMLDPEQTSLALVELVGGLSSQLALTRAQIRQLESSSPSSPQIASLRETAAALEAQIEAERSQLAGASEGLAGKVAEYERLRLEQDFLVRNLAEARLALETARNEARRQQLYLVRIVEPRPADDATEPRRLRAIFVVVAGTILLGFVGWLVRTGVREHAIEPR